MKIIDSDRDAAVNLDRLTVLVERLKAQNAELQVMLAASEDRVRVLEGALREIQRRTDGVTDVGWHGVNELRTLITVALNPVSPTAKEHCPRRLMGEELPPHMPCDTGDHSKDAPPSETTAPTTTCFLPKCPMPEHQAPVARDASVDAPTACCPRDTDGDGDCDKHPRWVVDRLRAKLAAANEELRQSRDNHEATLMELQEVERERDENLLKSGDVDCEHSGCGMCHQCLRDQAAFATQQLAAANAEIARLTRAADSARKDADAVRAEARRNADEDTNAWARAKLAEAAAAATTAKLGRAVVALQGVSEFLCRGPCFHGCEQARAILADADGTQAAAAWRELEAVYEAAKLMRKIHFAGDDAAAAWGVLDKALAAVDARGGGGR